MQIRQGNHCGLGRMGDWKDHDLVALDDAATTTHIFIYFCLSVSQLVSNVAFREGVLLECLKLLAAAEPIRSQGWTDLCGVLDHKGVVDIVVYCLE